MSIVSFTELVSRTHGGSDSIYLLHGYDTSCSQPAWYILKVGRLKLPLLREKIEARDEWLHLPDFGEILERGWGEAPPADVLARYETTEEPAD